MVNFCELDDSVPNPTNVCGVTRVIVNSDNRQNEKKYKQAASSFTDLKKCLEVTNVKAEGQQSTISTPNGPSNIGGPGDRVHSVNQITYSRSGFLSRLLGRGTGVDKKHGSYERYLARKKGRVYRCQIEDGVNVTCSQNK